MECTECDNIIHDFTRIEVVSDALRTEACEHIKHCTRCAARVSDIRSLEQAFRTLGETLDSERPPAHFNQTLRTVFQEQRQVKRRSQSMARWIAVGFAASLLLSVGVISRHYSFRPDTLRPDTRASSTVSTPRPVQPSSKAPSAPVAKRGEKIQPAAPIRRKITPRVSTPDRNAEEFVTKFYALPYAGSSGHMNSGEIVRVTLRASALSAIGFPAALNDDRAGERITADLLVGENGLPLAIRFVR